MSVKKGLVLLTLSLLGVCTLSGCTKDEVLDHYNNIVQSVGSSELTGNLSLQGRKKKGSMIIREVIGQIIKVFQIQNICLEVLQ